MKITDLKDYNVVSAGSFSPTPTATPEPQTQSDVPFPSKADDTGLEAGLKAVGNTPASAFNFGKNVLSAVASPIDTAKGLFDTVRGGGAKLRDAAAQGIDKVTRSDVGSVALGAGQTDTTTFDAVAQSIEDRYGSLEAAQRTATNDPFAVGADIAGIFTGTAALNKLDDINAAAKAQVAKRVSTKLDDVAVNQVEKAINLNPSDIRRIQQPNVAGRNPAEWLLEKGIQGNTDDIINKLDDLSVSSKATVDSGLAAIDARISAADAAAAQNTLKVLKNTFEGTIGNEAFVAKIDDLLARESYSLTELNDIKRLADAELSIFKSTGALKEGATSKGLFNVRDELKTLIENKAAENGFDGVKALNKDTQIAVEISKALSKRADVSNKFGFIGLRDSILGAGGFATAGPFGAVGAVATKKILESPQFRTFLANKLKSRPFSEIEALQGAAQTSRYSELLQALTPILNEFVNSQSQTTPSQERRQ